MSIIRSTAGVRELSPTNGRHVKTPTIVCDNCGRRYLQTRCRPWKRGDAWPEVLLCGSPKKGCLHEGMTGKPMKCYGETA